MGYGMTRYIVVGMMVSGLFAALPATAEQQDDTQAAAAKSDAVALEELEITGTLREKLERLGTLKDVIEKTEVVTQERLQAKQASNLSQAVENEPGIRVNNECSMCAIKRVMINGLKGEHTTILIDGVPVHSVVSSYYGTDAVTTAGVERIEVARGSGASLIAPEAIGGTINIVTKKAERNGATVDVSAGEDGYRRAALEATGVANEGRTRATLSAQYDDIDQFDGDDNAVNENPGLENRSVTMDLAHDLTPNDHLELRLASFRSNVQGGPLGSSPAQTIASIVEGETPAAELFENGDVRQTFTGNPWETAEIIWTSREEVTLRWLHAFGAKTNLQVTGNYVNHGQDSFYEGFDYVNDDDIFYGDVRLSHFLGYGHMLTIGTDVRSEQMRSQSDELTRLQAANPEMTGDSFDYRAFGGYLQDVWTPTQDLELSFALRLDGITADWIEQGDGNEISEFMVSPRFHGRYFHAPQWVSRVSAGRGYRAPLTFFESDHGILEDGFQTRVDDLEKSWSTGYALSFEGQRLSSTASFAWTRVTDIAFIDAAFGSGRPSLVNADDSVSVRTYDIVAGYEMLPGVSLGAAYEFFDYSDEYKSTFPVAPIEMRARLLFDYARGPWTFNSTLTWIGPRDLEDYGYGGRFNVFDDANGNGQVDAGELQDPKETDAPHYFTLDLRVAYQLTQVFSTYVGVNNLFDYNQADDEDSPLFWEQDGNEAAYDVGHIYAPLRGRYVFGGFKAKF